MFFRFMGPKSECCTLLTNYSRILNDISNTKNQILSCCPTSVYFPSRAPHFGLWICCWTQESGSVGRSGTRHSSILVFRFFVPKIYLLFYVTSLPTLEGSGALAFFTHIFLLLFTLFYSMLCLESLNHLCPFWNKNRNKMA